MNETILIEKLILKEEETFRVFIEQYQDMVLNTCFKFVHNKNDAEDIAQDVFVEVFLSIKRFKGDSKISTWLYRIAVNKSLDFIKKKNRKKRMAILTSLFKTCLSKEKSLINNSTPQSLIEENEKIRILLEAIEKLPENQKVAITLAKLEGLSYYDISLILKTTTSAIESLVQRAKQNLKKLLLNEDY